MKTLTPIKDRLVALWRLKHGLSFCGIGLLFTPSVYPDSGYSLESINRPTLRTATGD